MRINYLHINTLEVISKFTDNFQHPASFPQNLRTKSYEKFWSLWNEKSPWIELLQKKAKKKYLWQWCLNSQGEIWPQRQTVPGMKWRRGARVPQHPLDSGKYSPNRRNAKCEDWHGFHVSGQAYQHNRTGSRDQSILHPGKTEAEHWKRKLHTEKERWYCNIQIIWFLRRLEGITPRAASYRIKKLCKGDLLKIEWSHGFFFFS